MKMECTGSLLLGAAGLLEGKRATSNGSAYELLAPYCKEVVHARIVQDGCLFTGSGVSSSIDLGLYVLERLTDAATAEQVKSDMSYPYYQTGTSSSVYHAKTDVQAPEKAGSWPVFPVSVSLMGS